VITDVVFMEQVDMWPVLVHGGGARISEEMKRAGCEPEFVRGYRVTTPEIMEIVARVLIDEVSARICELVAEAGGRAMPLNGRSSAFLAGRKRTLPEAPEADLGLVGEVSGVDRESCYRLCDGGLIPVVAPVARLVELQPRRHVDAEEGLGVNGNQGSPLCAPTAPSAPQRPPSASAGQDGRDGAGANGVQLLNVNGDSAASAIAEGLGAEKVVFLSNVPGVLRDRADEDSLVSSLRRDEVDALVAEGVIAGGMLPKVASCIEAVERGVRKAHIVSALLPHALLLEMFTDRGIGTEIIA
jgi:acetylglutamate kinase